jgi:peptide chain release factor 1
MFSRLKESAERYRALEAALQDPGVHAEPARLSALLREMGALREKALTWERWHELERRRAATSAMLADADADVRAMAQDELAAVTTAQEAMVEELKRQVADDDPDRGRNVMLEVRAGTGGDEASLFAAELVRLYTRFAEQQGCGVELLSASPSEVGGIKEAVLGVSGPRAWDLFRYESGGHRVQRVPETESQGRIHTSAATVAVLPEAEEVDLQIRDADLRIDTFRSSGPGGQSVNKTSSAIRITHLPTNTVVQCQDESSQHKNKSKALRMLRTRLKDAQDQARKSAQDSTRRSQIGSGDRSERIRTYNFPQNRVTDHRIKTSYSLETVVLGHLEDVVEDLRRRDLELKLAALAQGAS